jgi:hypothetical protein
MGVFCIGRNSNYRPNFTKNEVLLYNWCKNYTIGNFTNMQPFSGNVPGKITVICTFHNDEKKIFLRVFAFWPIFFVVRTAKNCL